MCSLLVACGSQISDGFLPEAFGWFFHKLMQRIQGTEPCTAPQQEKLAAAGLAGTPHWPQVAEKLLRQMARAADVSMHVIPTSSSRGSSVASLRSSGSSGGGTDGGSSSGTGVTSSSSSTSKAGSGSATMGEEGYDDTAAGGEGGLDGGVVKLPAWVPPPWIF